MKPFGMNWHFRSGASVTLFICLLLSQNLLAQTEGPLQISGTNSVKGVAAYIDNEPINIQRLQLQVDLVLTKTEATGMKLDIIKAQVLEENIKQRLVNLYLQNSKYSATESEIEAQYQNLLSEIQGRKSTLPEYLKQRGISEAQLKKSISWDLAWAKYLDNYLTDKNLQGFFNKHRHRFDGTELSVAHILFQPEDIKLASSWDAARKRAESVAKEIKDGKISFENAVVKYSSGATKINRGELGWIGWRGPMAREFTLGAFQLKEGEVSQPVGTGFGVHLIKVLKRKPGMRTLEDVRPLVLQNVKRYLFDWLANKQAQKSKIKFTGDFPYFEYGTKKLGAYRK